MVKNQANSQLAAISETSEIINWANAQHIAMIDAKGVATDCDKYCKCNTFQTYLCVNTWLLLIKETLGDRAQYSVKNSIMRDGLLCVIDNASKLANSLIQYVQGGDKPLLPTGWFMPELCDMDLQVALQLLRYPKRFTPNNADKLLDTTIRKFRDINKRNKISNWDNQPEWILSIMRPIVRDMLKTFSHDYSECIPHFSSGSTTAGKTVYAKIKAYGQSCKYWCDPMYPIGDPTDCVKTNMLHSWWFTPKIIGVPKNYKTYRIIAPEHPYYAAEKQRIKDAIRLAISKSRYNGMYDPECQGTNQNLAREGAICGNYATIDLSSASDTVAESFVYYLFPEEVTDVMRNYRTEYLNIGGEWCRKRMFATSGDPLCFDVEAIVFLTICLTAGKIATHLTGENYLNPAVYGDDIIVDSRLFETVMDLLRILHFIPNDEKSFGYGGYRESCGVEYYYGYDVSTKYWPRAYIPDPRIQPISLENITALQQKLFHWWGVSKFLTDVVHAVYPTMTESFPGSDCVDLWADSPSYGKRSAPIAKDRISDPIPPEWTLREAHTTFTVAKSKQRDKVDLDLEMYHYVNFLHNGPIYSTPLDKLLGTSEPTSRVTDWEIPNTVITKSIV